MEHDQPEAQQWRAPARGQPEQERIYNGQNSGQSRGAQAGGLPRPQAALAGGGEAVVLNMEGWHEVMRLAGLSQAAHPPQAKGHRRHARRYDGTT